MTDKLEEVIASLQTMAPEVWAEAVGAVQLEGVFGLLKTALLGSITFVLYRRVDLGKVFRKEHDVETLITLITALILFIFALDTVYSFSTALEHIAFPQYVAVKELLGQ